MNDKTFNTLKWIAIAVIPALATFVGIILPTWNVANSDAIVTTLNAVGVLLATILGVSTVNYNKNNATQVENVEDEQQPLVEE